MNADLVRRTSSLTGVPFLAACALGMLAACSSYGGDTDPGVSARPVLEGGGTWQAPAERVAEGSSNGAVVDLELQGGTGDNFAQTGGTITLQVLLRDADGALVLDGLAAESFEVAPEGLTLEPIAAAAVAGAAVVDTEVVEVAVKPPTAGAPTGILLFDSSGSTRATDPERMRVEAARAFVDGMPDGTQLAVMDFGVSRGGIFGRAVVSPGLSDSRYLTDFTADRVALVEAIERVTSSGGTPMYGGLRDALRVIEAVHARGAAGLFVVVFTDGQAADYTSTAADAVVNRANAIEATLHTVALTGQSAGDDVNLAQLQQLAARTDGLSFTAFSADGLVAHFQQLAVSIDARITVRVNLKLNTALSAGTWRLRGSLEATANGGTAVAPFEIVLGVGG